MQDSKTVTLNRAINLKLGLSNSILSQEIVAEINDKKVILKGETRYSTNKSLTEKMISNEATDIEIDNQIKLTV